MNKKCIVIANLKVQIKNLTTGKVGLRNYQYMKIDHMGKKYYVPIIRIYNMKHERPANIAFRSATDALQFSKNTYYAGIERSASALMSYPKPAPKPDIVEDGKRIVQGKAKA